MSIADAVREHWLNEYQRVEARLPGRGVRWLDDLRETGLNQFAEIGLPTQRDEAWKYTDLRPIRKARFRFPDHRDVIDVQTVRPLASGDFAAHRLVFFDGRFMPELSALGSLPPGVTIASLAQVIDERPDELSEHLAQHSDVRSHGFVALNTAFMHDGAYIHLAAGAVTEHPIHLLFIASGNSSAVAHLRNLIIADQDSRAVIVESYVAAADAPYLNNAVTEIATGHHAQVDHYRIQRDSEQAFHVGGTYIHQQRDSHYVSHNVALGGRLVRNDLRAVLDAEGSECTLNGLYLTRGRQHVDNHTWIDHRKPHSTSREWYKGVLDERSRGIFSGRVVVHQDAQLSDAAQSNNNLLLSGDAEADSRPQLEIYADNVQCSHGCTVGQLDHDALFYLRSRGLSEALARGLLVYAFAADVLQRMNLTSIRSQLQRTLVSRLGGDRVLEALQ